MSTNLNIFTPNTGAKPEVEMRHNRGETKVINLDMLTSRTDRMQLCIFMNRGKGDIRDFVNALHTEAKQFLDADTCDECGRLILPGEGDLCGDTLLCEDCANNG